MRKIYFNGSILTMEEERNPEAVLVEEEKIKAVGTLKNCIEMSPSAERIDLKGKCLMPGFIDSHGHFVLNGQLSVCANLSECKEFEEIIAVLKLYIERNKLTMEDAVMGYGYDHNFLEEKEHPSRQVLDEVSTEIPIMILHVSGHLACANSAALKLAGVSGNGYFEEKDMALVSEVIWKRMKLNMQKIFSNMQKAYLENGITTVQDGATSKTDFELLKQMGEQQLLKVDVVSYPLMSNGGIELLKEEGNTYKAYKNHLKLGGYKLVLDGSPQGKSAWLSKPYLGEKAGQGCGWLSDDEVEDYVEQALREGRQLLAHCNGDEASEQFLEVYEKAIKRYPEKTDLRPVMIHCQTVRDDQLDRLAKFGMIASIFVGHVWYWGDIHLQNLGEERANRISPAKAALERGIVVDFHQDTPVTKPDMLHTIWCAVNRKTRSGQTLGADQRISVQEALKAVTINAAYGYFEEKEKGSIAVGKRADLVIIDKSPIEVPPMQIKDLVVLETIKDGETVYKNEVAEG